MKLKNILVLIFLFLMFAYQRLQGQTVSSALPVAGKFYSPLLEKLDASFVETSPDGKLYCRFLEKYDSEVPVTAKLYDWERNSYSLPEIVTYGENWMQFDLSIFTLVNREFYIFELTDQNNQKFFLRVKYIHDSVGDDGLSLACEAVTGTCTLHKIANEVVSTAILNGQAPYKVEWIYINEADAESTLHTEVTQNKDVSRTFDFTNSNNGDELKLRITDACGKTAECTFCFTTGGRIGKPSKIRFFIQSIFGGGTSPSKDENSKPSGGNDKIKH